MKTLQGFDEGLHINQFRALLVIHNKYTKKLTITIHKMQNN